MTALRGQAILTSGAMNNLANALEHLHPEVAEAAKVMREHSAALIADIKPLVKFTDIQDGTANHVRMIVNACAANDAKEAGYLADDLLDQLVSRALVVTRRVLPTMEWSVLQDRINELELRASTLTTQLQAAREGKRKVRELIKSALEALP